MTGLPNPGGAEPEAPFAEPWQAEAFALAMALVEAGVVSRADWAEMLGAEIRRVPAAPEEDAGAAYWRQWLAALDRLLAERGLVAPAEAAARISAWRDAYLRTPHGQPVELARGGLQAGR